MQIDDLGIFPLMDENTDYWQTALLRIIEPALRNVRTKREAMVEISIASAMLKHAINAIQRTNNIACAIDTSNARSRRK